MQEVFHSDLSSGSSDVAFRSATRTQTPPYIDYWSAQPREGVPNLLLVRQRRRQYEELWWGEEPAVSLPPEQEPEDTILVESGILPFLLAQAEQEPPSENWRRDLAEL